MNWLSTLLGNLNYGTIFLLMLLESTVIPVPSEFVVSPAAYLAGHFLGRPIIYRFANSKWGKMCLLNQHKVEKSEKYFYDHGMVATITGRLIPGIRHLISIPAGLAKMKYWQFLLYTTIGAGAWNCILAALGWYLHSAVPEDQLNDKIMEYGDYIKFFIMVAVAIAFVYFLFKWYFNRRKQQGIK